MADSSQRSVFVAGSVGPTGEIMEPIGDLSHKVAVEVFLEQAQGLKDGGADVSCLETISAHLRNSLLLLRHFHIWIFLGWEQ